MRSLPLRSDLDTAARSFWRWFAGIASELAANFENHELLEELDAKVARLGGISWELGPGRVAENALVITPDGARDKLEITQRIIALAPEVPGWEFHSAKPPRDWDLRFSIEGDSGHAIDVDARDWRYVLLKYPDGKFEILIEQANLLEVTESDRYAAATILLDGILGEENRLRLISEIDPQAMLPADFAERSSRVEHLAQHLESLVPLQ